MAPSAPLLSTLGPLREQFQLHQDSKQQATQVRARLSLLLLCSNSSGFAMPNRRQGAAKWHKPEFNELTI